MLACVATSFAVLFAREANTVAIQRDAAIVRALVADGERLSESDPELARRLAITAWRLSPTPESRAESRANLLASLARPGLAVLSRGDGGGGGSKVAFDPAGRLFTAGTRIWDLTTRRPVGELPTTRPSDGDLPMAGAAAFSFDGLTIATMGDSEVRLWDARTREQRGTLEVSGMALAFSPTEPLLAVAEGRQVQVWDIGTRKRVRSVPHDVTAVAFSANGKRLITASEDRIVVWEVRTGKKVRTLRGIHHQGQVSLAVSPDGRTVATGSSLAHSGPADLRVRLWDIKNGQEVDTLDGHTDSITSLAFSRDGGMLAAGSADETVLVWDLATHRLALPALTGHNGSVTSLAFGPGGVLATAQDAGDVRLWNVSTGFTLRPSHTAAVDTAVFGPDGTLATGSRGGRGPRQGLPLGSNDQNIRLWNPVTRRAAGLIGIGELDTVSALAFGPGGRLIAGASSGRVSGWSVSTRRREGPVIKAREPVTALAVNADATVIATSSYGSRIELWDPASGRPIGSPLTTKADTLSSAALAFSPTDRSLLAMVDADNDAGNVVRLRDVGSGRALSTLAGHTGPVAAVTFSPGGSTIATGGADNTVRLWNAATRSPIGGSLATGGDVTSIAFSPVGGLLAVGDADGDIRLWDLGTRRQIGAVWPAHLYAVNTLAFSPDGRTLASGGEDFETRLWDLTFTLDPLRSICASAPRPLTAAQWATHVPDVELDPRLQAC